ncbi:MAG: PA2169 family four-helix-bundle protein [Polyangiaceae bacterium]
MPGLATERFHLGSLLNELVRVALDAARGYQFAAEHSDDRALGDWFRTQVEARARHAMDMQREIEDLREFPASAGSLLGDLHRTWMGMNTPFGATHDVFVVEACLDGDQHALETYERVLRTGSWHTRGSAHALVRAQRDALLAACKSLRDWREKKLLP